MTEKKKIGIEQYIPFELINATILEYLETKDINKDELFQRMLEYNKGENRAKKPSNSIYSAITKTSFINKALLKNLTTESYNRLSMEEKNVITMSLICIRYPFIFDTLTAFGKLFNVQDSVNRQYITQTLASIYGSNRTLDIALDAVLRMLVDSGFIIRVKQGLFAKGSMPQICDFAKEVWISTFFELNGKKSLPVSELKYEPVLSFLIDTEIDWKNTKILETMQDYSNQLVVSKLE